MEREQELMSDADETYRLAEAAFERNDFVEFRRLVQEAALATPPNQAILTLLDMAAEFEQLGLSRRIVAWHPQSLDARLQAIHWTVRTANESGPWQGLYAELLEEQRGNEVNESRVRLSRLRSSVDKHAFETLYEDVRWLWSLAKTSPEARFVRKTVLRHILRIDRPSALPAIRELRALIVDERAAEVLELKEKELAAFARWE
jgi:hypothetical protein